MCSLINKQLLLTAYAYLFIMGQQKTQQGGEALQLQLEMSKKGAKEEEQETFVQFIADGENKKGLIKFLQVQFTGIVVPEGANSCTSWYEKTTPEIQKKIREFIGNFQEISNLPGVVRDNIGGDRVQMDPRPFYDIFGIRWFVQASDKGAQAKLQQLEEAEIARQKYAGQANVIFKVIGKDTSCLPKLRLLRFRRDAKLAEMVTKVNEVCGPVKLVSKGTQIIQNADGHLIDFVGEDNVVNVVPVPADTSKGKPQKQTRAQLGEAEQPQQKGAPAQIINNPGTTWTAGPPPNWTGRDVKIISDGGRRDNEGAIVTWEADKYGDGTLSVITIKDTRGQQHKLKLSASAGDTVSLAASKQDMATYPADAEREKQTKLHEEWKLEVLNGGLGSSSSTEGAVSGAVLLAKMHAAGVPITRLLNARAAEKWYTRRDVDHIILALGCWKDKKEELLEILFPPAVGKGQQKAQ